MWKNNYPYTDTVIVPWLVEFFHLWLCGIENAENFIKNSISKILALYSQVFDVSRRIRNQNTSEPFPLYSVIRVLDYTLLVIWIDIIIRYWLFKIIYNQFEMALFKYNKNGRRYRISWSNTRKQVQTRAKFTQHLPESIHIYITFQ